jgi:hypothetical protein
MLTEAIGTEAADMLMDELPPLAWSDLATNAAMNALAQTLRAEMAKGTNKLVFATMAMWIATMGTVGGMFAALAH